VPEEEADEEPAALRVRSRGAVVHSRGAVEVKQEVETEVADQVASRMLVASAAAQRVKRDWVLPHRPRVNGFADGAATILHRAAGATGTLAARIRQTLKRKEAVLSVPAQRGPEAGIQAKSTRLFGSTWLPLSRSRLSGAFSAGAQTPSACKRQARPCAQGVQKTGWTANVTSSHSRLNRGCQRRLWTMLEEWTDLAFSAMSRNEHVTGLAVLPPPVAAAAAPCIPPPLAASAAPCIPPPLSGLRLPPCSFRPLGLRLPPCSFRPVGLRLPPC
jgi:hypothetical protein